jgi:hypothetical protein
MFVMNALTGMTIGFMIAFPPDIKRSARHNYQKTGQNKNKYLQQQVNDGHVINRLLQ